ncbi:MAG: MotA/TolQ/ExbB proton channel family protein [Candidatus Eremiobacteraeota bacterium]|nr:MotA/TolQ/ExbB proton channel family protein [Candidatus Eremiobacteraeota bacterium]
MNLFQFAQQGGIFMVPLILLSLLSMAVGLERTFYFANLHWGGDVFRNRLVGLLREGKEAEAIQWLQGLRGAVAGTALAGARRWSRGRASMESAMVAQSHRDQAALHRFLVVLETTVTASPLIGLLGTITGMMGVFRAVSSKIAENPQADTSSILAGIGEALVATAAGILIAVVSLFIHNLFQRLAERQMDEAQDVANELVDLIDEKSRA